MISTLMLLTLASGLDPQAPDSLDGPWAGGYTQPGEFVSLEVQFEGSGGEGAVRVQLPEMGFETRTSLERDGDAYVWRVRDDEGEERARFEGVFDGDRVQGTVSGSGIQGEPEFNLLRVVELDPAVRQGLLGTYRIGDDMELEIIRVPRSLQDALGVQFPAAGLQSILFPVTESRCVAGHGEAPFPTVATFDFTFDSAGRVQSIEVAIDGNVATARPMDPSPSTAMPALAEGLGVERRRVTIDAGDVTLSATLYLPPGVERPCPAVVQLHGSAPTQHASQWFYYTSPCLRSGLAVLAFDKRGCGESTGSYEGFTVENSERLFDQLANDGAAAHRWLRKQDGIDPERVGLVGGSQAGWIMPLVAEKAEGVRFIISGCGPTVSAGEEDFHGSLIQSGVPGAEADRRLESYDGPRGFDPRRILRRGKTPILWLFGERDDVIPTGACLTELGKLAEEGFTHHDVHVFPDTDHNFRTSRGEGVLLEPVITHWLVQRGVLRR